MFQVGILRRKRGAIANVVVGNLTVGGTGKTPFVIWLAARIKSLGVAVLSRGYGRETKGFFEVEKGTDPATGGDEPVEIAGAVGRDVPVFVCENRLHGLHEIKRRSPNTELVILDDGFQHLKLLPDFAILLCNFNRPFFNDWPMPYGRLREFAMNARYSDAIVVSKCPPDLTMEAGLTWFQKLSGYGKPVFFASYTNSEALDNTGDPLKVGDPVVLVSAVEGNAYFEEWARSKYKVADSFCYPDHHVFTEQEGTQWTEAAKRHGAQGLLVTRKDLKKVESLALPVRVFESHTGVEILFDGEEDLIRLILTKIER